MKRRRLIVPCTLIGGAVLVFAVLCWVAAGYVLIPPRKALGHLQSEWLATARTEHGLRVARSVTPSGVPYLLCEPSGAAIGRRGRILREQLAAKGVALRPFGEMRGTIVLVHGRGCRKEDFLMAAERFCAAGFRCLLPDLPGHGDNPANQIDFGVGKTGRTLPRDVLESAAARYRFPTRPAGLWGISLGGAYAIQAAAEKPNLWSALVVVSSFDELEPVIRGEARRLFGNFAPVVNLGLAEAVRWRGGFWISQIRPATRAASLNLPAMIVHGTADELIKIERGRRLYEVLPDKRKRWLAVTGARHGDVLVTPMHVFAEISAFYLASLTPR